MIKVEIASYPKSGNTWFRNITLELLKNLTGLYCLPEDIHQNKSAALSLENKIYLDEISNEVFFYKSHVHDNTKISPNSIIHIYRHPLDVFLSARNFFYIESLKGNLSQDRVEALFSKGEPKPVEEALKVGELDYYFDEFLEEVCAGYFPGMLGELSNYFKYVEKAMRSEKTISIKYEDLVANLNDTSKRAFEYSLGVSLDGVVLDCEAINKRTKGSGKPFYWKAKPNNFKDFLTEKQIDSFYKKYGGKMKEIGYQYGA